VTSDVDAQAVDPSMLRKARAQRADLRKAMLNLEDALASPVPGRLPDWTVQLHDALDVIAATFERHIGVTEGENGFLAEIAEHSPRLINAIQRLYREHHNIRGEISALLEQTRQLESDGDEEGVEALRDRVTILMGSLVRHRQRGADLVYEAHAVDIGGSD
jgi:hypothetical protein